MLVLEFGIIILRLSLDGANISLLFSFLSSLLYLETLFGMRKSVTAHGTSPLRFYKTIKWEVEDFTKNPTYRELYVQQIKSNEYPDLLENF